MQAARCPTDELSLTNCVVANEKDYKSGQWVVQRCTRVVLFLVSHDVLVSNVRLFQARDDQDHAHTQIRVHGEDAPERGDWNPCLQLTTGTTHTLHMLSMQSAHTPNMLHTHHTLRTFRTHYTLNMRATHTHAHIHIHTQTLHTLHTLYTQHTPTYTHAHTAHTQKLYTHTHKHCTHYTRHTHKHCTHLHTQTLHTHTHTDTACCKRCARHAHVFFLCCSVLCFPQFNTDLSDLSTCCGMTKIIE